jgi:hypothetical protein
VSERAPDNPDSIYPPGAAWDALAFRALPSPRTGGVRSIPDIVVTEGPQRPAPTPPGVIKARRNDEEPLPEPPPAPEPPTEAELRDTLRQCNAVRDFAAANQQRAAATLERARRHAVHCEERLASFDDLDEQISRATVEQLSDEHRARIEMPDTLRHRQAQQHLAKADLAAATSARETLAAALREADAELATATQNATRAALAILAGHATAWARAHDEALVEAANIRDRFLAPFDRIASAQGMVPPDVLRVLRQHSTNMLRRDVDTSVWRHALDALLQDADASGAWRVQPARWQTGLVQGAVA